jgi:hypothetical protein
MDWSFAAGVGAGIGIVVVILGAIYAVIRFGAGGVNLD